jgi:hypothetical protein
VNDHKYSEHHCTDPLPIPGSRLRNSVFVHG